MASTNYEKDMLKAMQRLDHISKLLHKAASDSISGKRSFSHDQLRESHATVSTQTYNTIRQMFVVMFYMWQETISHAKSIENLYELTANQAAGNLKPSAIAKQVNAKMQSDVTKMINSTTSMPNLPF